MIVAPSGAPAQLVSRPVTPVEMKIVGQFLELWSARRDTLFGNRFLGVRTLQNPLDAWVTQEILFARIFADGCMHYAINHTLFGNENQWTAGFPLWGWVIMNNPYNITPVIALFNLQVANKNWFTEDREAAAGRRPYWGLIPSPVYLSSDGEPLLR